MAGTRVPLREQLARRARLDIMFDTDVTCIRSVMELMGKPQEEIREWEQKSKAEHWARSNAICSCPDGSVPVWMEEEVMLRSRLIAIPMTCLMVVSAAHSGGVVIREENDAFAGSDDQYTQGLDLLFTGNPVKTSKGISVRSFGLRNLMYTPRDIGIAENQPDERPWAGLSSLVMEDWKKTPKNFRRIDWMVGVLGEWSQSEEIQKWFHKLTDSREPMGWDNQIPNEPFVNVCIEYYKPLYVVGRDMGFDLTGLYGGNLGTAFVNGEAGLLARAGWNIPDDYSLGLINPTAINNDFSVYGFAEAKGRLVAHNATLGGSLWQDGTSRDMELLVADLRYGVAAGVERVFGSDYTLRLSYSKVLRTKEFEQQEDLTDYGAVFLSIMGGF